MTDKKREWDFGEYLRVGEPEKREKALAWSAAIGLQQVDGLIPSKYLYETALRNIEGDISIDDAKKLIDSKYAEKSGIGAEKSGIEKIVNASRFNSPTKARILKLVYALKFDEIFGASTVMDILPCKATAATAIIQRMKDLAIVDAVTGHGKGKYRLTRNPIFSP